MPLIDVIANDRMGKKVRIKCSPDDTVGDLKKLIAAQTGTAPEKVSRHARCSQDTIAEYDGCG